MPRARTLALAPQLAVTLKMTTFFVPRRGGAPTSENEKTPLSLSLSASTFPIYLRASTTKHTTRSLVIVLKVAINNLFRQQSDEKCAHGDHDL